MTGKRIRSVVAGALATLLLALTLVAACAVTPRHGRGEMASIGGDPPPKLRPPPPDGPPPVVIAPVEPPRDVPEAKSGDPLTPRPARPGAWPPPAPAAQGEHGAGAVPPPAVVASVDDQLAKRPIAYNRPKELRFGEPAAVKLVIYANSGDVQEDFSGMPGAVTGRQIPVSREMTAELSGPDNRVKIQLRKDFKPWQRLTTAGNPTWIWDVTAEAPGTAILDLTIKAKVVDADGATEQVVRSYHDTIPVRVGVIDAIQWWIGRIDAIWKWLVGVVTVLGGAFVWWRTNVARKPA